MKLLQIAALACLASTGARAAAIPDVAPWAAEFQAAALANKPEAMIAEMRDVLLPGFPADALAGIVTKIDGVIGDEPGDHAEQFDERNLGTFMKRINVAVHYPHTYMFYSLTFLHGPAGWQLGQFDYNTNVNEVMDLKWPK